MKNVIKIFPIVLFLLVLLSQVSCENEQIENFNSLKESLAKVDIEILSQLSENLDFENTVVLQELNSDFANGQFYQEIDYTNIQSDLFQDIQTPFYIDALILYTSNNEVKGIGVYYYFEKSNTLKFHLLNNTNNRLIGIDGFPKTVDNVINKDILYVANTYFNYSNTRLIYDLERVEYNGLSKNYNDLSAERVAKRLINTHKKKYSSNNLAQRDMDPQTGCGYTHSCINGNSSDACLPSGCVGICRFSEIKETVNQSEYAQENNLNINRLIPVQKLYDFKNILESSPIGRDYIDIYYNTNSHFLESINTNITVSLFSIAPSLNNVIDRLNNENYTGVIYDTTFANALISILESSSNNSQSNEYKQIISLITADINKYKNLNKSNFLYKLNNG